MRATMRHVTGPLGRYPVLLLTIYLALPAHAHDALHSPAALDAAIQPPVKLTGKERLGRKWMDEQRIDNCNVPTDKRGTKPRPSICHNPPPVKSD